MYTYVFDDKENEVALNNIKAIIFDIISNEKAKQAIFRERVINSGNTNLQQAFLSVSSQQDEILNSFMFVGNQLGELLKKTDSLSRELREVDVNNFEVAVDSNSSAYNNDVANNNNVSVPVTNQPSIEDLYSNDSATFPDVSQNGNKSATGSVEIIEDAKDDTPSLGESASSEVIPTQDDSVKEEVVPEVHEAPASDEMAVVDSEDASNKDKEVEEVPASEEAVDAGDKGDDKPSEEKSTVQLVIPGASSAKVEEEVPEETASSSPLIIPTADAADNETNSTKLVIPGVSNSNDAVEDKKEEEKAEEAPVTIVNNPPQVIPDVNSDPTLDALLANNSDDAKKAPLIVFKKRGEDLARAILTSGKQTGNLRKSLATQEALLGSRGFFENIVTTNVDDASLEQKLVDNGLLPGEEGQAQIEEMMNQANALYAAGKLEEAQAMYDKISELNKKVQENVEGTAKAA